MANGFDLLHHPLHAMALRARAAEVGASFFADIPAYEVAYDGAEGTGLYGFLLAHLDAL